MYIDLRDPIRTEMNGRVKQRSPWHTGRKIGSNLLIYILSGALTLRIGDEIYSGKAGTAFLIPAQVQYAPTQVSELEYLFFHFNSPKDVTDKSDSQKISATSSLPQGEYAYTYSLDASPVISVPVLSETAGNRRIRELIDRIIALNVWASDGEKLLLDCYLREFLVLLGAGFRTSVSRNLGTILQFIDCSYSSDVSLTALSQKFGFSRSYIARLFRNELKMTSSDYVNRVRVGAACDRLANSDMRISEISEAVGFTEQYYFSRIFRQLCGMTPTEFKKKREET